MIYVPAKRHEYLHTLLKYTIHFNVITIKYESLNDSRGGNIS